MGLQMLAATQYVPIETVPTRYYYLPLVGSLFRKRVTRCLSLLPRGGRVLEIGYGNGVSFLNLRDKFDEIHGVDVHRRPEEVRRSFASTPLNLHLKQGSVLSLPYENDSFDAALAISVHEHLHAEEQSTAVREVARVVRPGGCYVVGVPGLNAMMVAAFDALGWNCRQHHFSSETRVLEAMQHVFEVDTVRFYPRFWPRSLTTYLCIRGRNR